jgi:hypothetical protein
MGLLSLGLRLMQTPGKFGAALGSAGMGALSDMQAAQDRQMQGKEREQAQRMRAMQEQALQLQLAQTLQEQKRRQGVEEAYRGAMVSPATQALAGGGGPTVQNAAAMQGLTPKLDQGRLMQGLMGADPMMAAQMLQPKARKLSRLETMRDNAGKPVNVAVFEDGSTEVLPYGVKPEIALMALGDRTQAVDKSMLRGGETFREGLSPSGRVAAQANNIAADANNLQRMLQLRGLQADVDAKEAKSRELSQSRQAGIATMADSIQTIDKALTHPGRTTATGVSGQIDPRNYLAGTDATNFKVLMDQIGGKAFLQAFESLKGGGQITETEGKKATDAIARLNRAQSDAEFQQALVDFRQVLSDAYKRNTGQDYRGPSLNPKMNSAPSVKFLGFE